MAEGVLPFNNLADRELIALRCLVRGGDMDTVAAALSVSRDVVSVLRRRLLTKLGLSTDEELIGFGRRYKLS
ncbi:response regulator [compost metagenome]